MCFNEFEAFRNRAREFGGFEDRDIDRDFDDFDSRSRRRCFSCFCRCCRW